ncbi:MAG: hypothetical protein K2N34_15330 [Lachnospiraceae bacterium]|nr:hypothetical protein [Lachnospiraceae bacterium]
MLMEHDMKQELKERITSKPIIRKGDAKMNQNNNEQNNNEQNNGSQNNSNQLRLKNMMYEQQLARLPMQSVDKLTELIEKNLKPKKYALIVHDKDMNENGQPKADHVHVMLCFENARSINNVAKQLGDKPQSIEAWTRESGNGFAYLIHATDNARLKHQYDISEVKANFDYAAMMQKITAEVKKADTMGEAAKIKTLLDLLYVGGITKSQIEEQQLTGMQYAKYKRAIEDVSAKGRQNLAKEWRKKMREEGKPITTIWICGKTGTGKSSLAKEYAMKRNEPYYVAGSSRDIFQNYEGEHILILDELRPKSIPYEDLLRILDPFGMGDQVMSPSRYHDKALTCDLIIITSPYNPFTFYTEMHGYQDYRTGLYKEDPIDRFDQLNRRISLTIHTTDTEICKMNYDEQKPNRYCPDIASIKPNPYSAANRPPMTINADDIYKSMFE